MENATIKKRDNLVSKKTGKSRRTIKDPLSKLPTQQVMDFNKWSDQPISVLYSLFFFCRKRRKKPRQRSLSRRHQRHLKRPLEASSRTLLYLKPRRRQAGSHGLERRRGKKTTQLQRWLITSLQDQLATWVVWAWRLQRTLLDCFGDYFYIGGLLK